MPAKSHGASLGAPGLEARSWHPVHGRAMGVKWGAHTSPLWEQGELGDVPLLLQMPPHLGPVLTATAHLHTLRSRGCPTRPGLQHSLSCIPGLTEECTGVSAQQCSLLTHPGLATATSVRCCLGKARGVVLRRPTGRYQSPLSHLFLLASLRGCSECPFWLPGVGFPSSETSSLLLGGHTRTFHHPSLILKVWSRV